MKIKQYFIKGNKFVPYVSKDDVKLVELMTVMPFLQKKYLVVALSQWPLARDNSNDVDKNYMKVLCFCTFSILFYTDVSDIFAKILN
ncbi:hypothetical protein T11_1143 [Trichinella zimbabwensis]|uniref:Uncharacterized protein n=1 Tax=Trichinella zimbabwensis TaxID=268475 RepID=A0A0V1HTZ7_9BILA|nr:hypothetical protein T11_1143 [Trichinella zimbabwensis]